MRGAARGRFGAERPGPRCRGAGLRAALGLALFARAAGLCAYTYDMAPAPPVATAPAVARLYLEPFKDARRNRDLWKGTTRFERVAVEAKGLAAEDKAWAGWDYGSASILWHRQLGRALAQAGIAAVEAPAPLPEGAAESRAESASGAAYVLGGDILGLSMDKRGADGFFGTTFSGTDYVFSLRLRLVLRPAAPGGASQDREWDYVHTFHDPTALGRRDRDTFPAYFAQGLSMAAAACAADPGLRAALGLAPASAPGPGIRTTAAAPATAACWINPRTGKRMDPAWNFDPADGTPRKDFVLVPASGSGESAPTPVGLTPTAGAPAASPPAARPLSGPAGLP